MNNIVIDCNNHFDKTSKKERQQQKQEEQKQNETITLPSFVSTCLAPHEECTGHYTDTFNLFRLLCGCTCHSRSHLPKEAGN